MVPVADVERLTAEIKIQSVSYNIEQESAIITFFITVSYSPFAVTKAFSMEINVREEEIKRIENLLDEKRNTINQSLKEIKSKISSLLQFSENVEVNLNEISKKLMDAVK